MEGWKHTHYPIQSFIKYQGPILVHTAAIWQENRLFLLWPFVGLGSLDVFLRGGWLKVEDSGTYEKIYEFDERFPLLRDEDRLRRAIVKEAFDLVVALLWLHEGSEANAGATYMAHTQLKPSKILIDGDSFDPGSPAGHWKICDFDLAAFEKATNHPATSIPQLQQRDLLPIRDYAACLGHHKKSSSFTKAYRKLHKFTGPSRVEEGRPSTDLRVGNITALGGILCDLLAFILERKTGVKKVERLRADEDLLIIEPGTSTQFQEWLEELVRNFKMPWVKTFAAIITGTLGARSEMKDLRWVMSELEGLSYLLPTKDDAFQESLSATEYRAMFLEQLPDALPRDLHVLSEFPLNLATWFVGTLSENERAQLVDISSVLPFLLEEFACEFERQGSSHKHKVAANLISFHKRCVLYMSMRRWLTILVLGT